MYIPVYKRFFLFTMLFYQLMPPKIEFIKRYRNFQKYGFEMTEEGKKRASV